MAIQLVRQFSFSDGAHNFNMLLKAPVVGIGGYSGTGKTFFFNTVKDLKSNISKYFKERSYTV